MIKTFDKALKVQTRRYDSEKPFISKAVKRYLKKETPTPTQLHALGNVTITPIGFKRSKVFDK